MTNVVRNPKKHTFNNKQLVLYKMLIQTSLFDWPMNITCIQIMSCVNKVMVETKLSQYKNSS